MDKFIAKLTLTAAVVGIWAVLHIGNMVAAADYWVSANDPIVVTNNDCGFVSAVHGEPLLRRSFRAEGEAGVRAYVADRVNSGDELVAPVGSRLEWVSGDNVVAVLGSGARVRLGGLRNFTTGGKAVTRLDLELLEGEIRVQVRRNNERPSAVLVSAAGAEVLVQRGDAEIVNHGAWQVAVLSGSVLARVRRLGTIGAPFTIEALRSVGPNGEQQVEERMLLAIKGRVPFSFETRSAALPPLPPMTSVVDAP